MVAAPRKVSWMTSREKHYRKREQINVRGVDGPLLVELSLRSCIRCRIPLYPPQDLCWIHCSGDVYSTSS